jgi:signal transduction histidine kinase
MKQKILIAVLTALFISSGISFASTEALSPELCKTKAKAAAALLKVQGDAALEKIKDPNGEFRFADGKGYVWIHNLDGVMVMHPIKPALDGKGLLDMRDINGVYLFVAMNELCEEKGEGWVPYSWPKPGEEKSSPKVSYVVLVEHGGKSYVAGSGMYDVTPKDIQSKFPGDAVYEDD